MTNGNGATGLDVVEAAPDSVRRQRAARIRAARAYAGIDQASVAQLFGVSVQTIKRMEAGKREISVEEMLEVARLCDVPAVFMIHGFDAITAAPFAHEDAQQLCDQIAELVHAEFERRFADLSRALLAEHEARAVAREALEHLAG